MKSLPLVRTTAFKRVLPWLAFPLAGILQTLTLAPYNLWPLGILSLGILLYQLEPLARNKGFFAGWLFGIGLFGSGASWVYISIHTYGHAPVPLAAIMTIIFVAGLSLFPAITLGLFHRYLPMNGIKYAAAFAGTWILGDYFREIFLTGFPWLYLGYGHLQSPLSGWAPIVGVHGITFIVAATAALLATIPRHWTRYKNWQWAIAACVISLPWIAGYSLKKTEWTQESNTKTLNVAIMQGNISLEEKWNPAYRMTSLKIYEQLSEPHWETADIILWPETAIPFLLDQVYPYLQKQAEHGKQTNTTLITGIPYRGPATNSTNIVFHNSIVSVGQGQGLYHKQKLVPFGEFVPLEQQLRGLIEFFNLPMSNFAKGASDQPLLTAGEATIASYICYEVVYPDFAAKLARNADLLLTISNDSWFGASIGPLQHLQMAQMRALENQRYMLRGTNNGISAIINHRGEVTTQSPQFKRTSITDSVTLRQGQTPYQQFCSWPVLLLSAMLICATFLNHRYSSSSPRGQREVMRLK